MAKKSHHGLCQPRAMFIAGLMGKGWTRKNATEAWAAWQLSKGKEFGAEVMNYAQAAQFVGIAEGTLRHWVSTGLNGVPHIKFGRGGGRVLFRRSSLVAWLASRERVGTQVMTTQPTGMILEAR